MLQTPPTPIEREIRLHLEREELLRRERGLGSSRSTQEYVEVCIKPILSQSMESSIKPKEKERQWAGVQMQREIQRECRREEDLVQLGKVRGTYDRGTPQELQEKKMIFDSSSNSCTENARGPSFAEVNRMSNVIILDSGVVAEPKQHTPGRASLASPFFCLRAKSSQSLLYQEVREVQEREQELQRQRLALYGSSLPCHPAEDSNRAEEVPSPPGKYCRMGKVG
uniref:MISP family member 3 n=1 Tax=Naja naja TaxID=35670 RepID=A0A8C6X8P1_NAJNA